MVIEKKAEIVHLRLILSEVPSYGQNNQFRSDDKCKSDISTTNSEIIDNENESFGMAEVGLLMDAMSQLDSQGETNTPAVETLVSELAIRRPGIDGDW